MAKTLRVVFYENERACLEPEGGTPISFGNDDPYLQEPKAPGGEWALVMPLASTDASFFRNLFPRPVSIRRAVSVLDGQDELAKAIWALQETIRQALERGRL